MAYIILPSRRTRQPQGAVRVDWRNPLTRGLQFASVGGNGTNVASGFPLSGSAGFAASQHGVVRTFNGSSQQLSAPYTTTTAAFTLFALAKCTNQTATNTLISLGSAGSGFMMLDLSGTESSDPLRLYVYDGTLLKQTYSYNPIYNEYAAFCGVVPPLGGTMVAYQNGVLRSHDTGERTGYNFNPVVNVSVGANYTSGAPSNYFNGDIAASFFWNRDLSAQEVAEISAEISANPWQLFAPDSRRLYFGASGGGATIITASGAASLVARAAAAVAATKTAAAASRATIAGTASTTSIRTSALVAKARSAGAAATTTLRTATIAARTVGAGTAATITLRIGLAAGRLTSNAQTTYAAIIAGAFTAAGRTSARGTAAYASTHTATAAATATTSGAAAATTLREGIAVARVDARAAVTAAALVAGTITTTAAAQISARASVSNTTERSAALAAMLALRGANPAAPELPVIVPPSTRTLSPDHTRLGLSPVAPAKPRLG